MSADNSFTVNRRCGVTLLIVLAMMVLFAMLVTTYMVIVSQNRRFADQNAKILLNPPYNPTGVASGSVTFIPENGNLDVAFQRLMSGSSGMDNVIAPHSILADLYGVLSLIPYSGTGVGYDADSDSKALLSLRDGADRKGKPFALRPNSQAPDSDGEQRYKEYLKKGGVRMNSDYTAPDYMTMFLAWNDFSGSKLNKIIPSFHRPQLVRYWEKNDSAGLQNDLNELRKYVLRPLPTDHPAFTGRNPAAKWKDMAALKKFLTEGPWDVDNDGNGEADGIWLDIGLGVQYDEGTDSYYKPLVSYYVLDMDGRIDVNTFGNPEKSTPPSKPAGMGLGAAELFSELLTKKFLDERAGRNSKPVETGNDLLIYLLQNNGINIDAYTKGGLVADWLGTVPIDFDNLGNRIAGTLLPAADIPYLRDPYDTDNGAFHADDLESLLRSWALDLDFDSLPPDLRDLLDDPFNPDVPTLVKAVLRYSLTTRSSDIPIAAPLYDRVRELCGGDQSKTDELWKLLPEEIQQETSTLGYGKKVNLNRLTLSPNWAVHWKKNATQAERDALLVEKFKFAQEMFYLLRILKNPQTAADLERLAQWSINLVDFIDPDDVMTPFIFRTDNTPEDCIGLINDLLAGKLTLGKDYALIWGLEKSEVILTETFAFHDRQVRYKEGPPASLEQAATPQGSLFVEIYRQGNTQRDYSASCLVNLADGTLDLSKTTQEGKDYIWRLAIGEATKTVSGQSSKWREGNTAKNALYQLLIPDGGNIKYPQFSQWHSPTPGEFRPDLGVPERFIWFGKDELSEQTQEPENGKRSFYNKDGMNVIVLPPNSCFVVAPIQSPSQEYKFPNTNVSINLAGKRWMSAATQSGGRFVNVSEPLDGYLLAGTALLDDGFFRQRGTVPCYKTICLQRLADPNREHDTIGNPYLTVDWSMIDLQVVNNVENPTSDPAREGLLSGDKIDYDMRLSSRQWKIDSNLWDRTLSKTELGDDKAGLETTNFYNTYGPMTTQPRHTLGTPPSPPPPSLKFMHFPWNDAPLMNTGELMLVPSSAPGRFGVEFHDNGKDNDFFGTKPRFGYQDVPGANAYLDWENADLLSCLCDFVHVPSKFTGAIKSMQEPGKINLNTLTEEGWKSLQNGRSNSVFPSYADFCKYRQWSAIPNDPTYPSEFRPFRSPSATHLVPPMEGGNPDTLVGNPVSGTLLGLENGGKPVLMDNEADNPYSILENVARLTDVTTTRSNIFAIWITVGYFHVEKCKDLDELKKKYPKHDFTHITGETMFKAVYPDGYVLGAELGQPGDDEMGISDGTVRRHRAFYLIDRSIPIAKFQHGMEVEKTSPIILKKTLLEQAK
ncbi:MAG: hypothetical protein LBI05_11805 [Planctomycetaceae bacterium]|jgi:hypothetical protein|nr:hypothetical protein [Planctomycetaceae bacterium]